MNLTFWQRLDLIVRGITPFVLTLMLVVLGQVPLHVPGFAEVAPLLPLMAVYHWAIYRPDLLPAIAVFFAGLLQDALSGMPFGVNTAVFVIMHMVVIGQSTFFVGKSFLIVWLGFGMVAAAATILTWLLTALFFSAFTTPDAAFAQYVITVGLFPILAWLQARWQQTVLAQV
ncbi:rod shape-determining protein MreD [Magnetovibrio sp. PR-2]|uniref:rod shape-determining protein MreD n=1 Tax=Magnetovibrio sp. PR-2 TaxID=3120356 RepID=UPI002FCE34B5